MLSDAAIELSKLLGRKNKLFFPLNIIKTSPQDHSQFSPILRRKFQ